MIHNPNSQEAPTIQHPAVRLIATDIDGTLLNSENMLPAANHAAVQRALAQGVQLALVTARKRSSTLAVAAQLGVPCACIAHNGARIWDWSGQELRHLVIDLDLAHAIVAFADRHDLALVVTMDEVNYYSRSYPFNPAWQSRHDQVVPMLNTVLERAPTRIIVAGNRDIDAIVERFGTASETLVLHRYYSREGALASAVLTHPRATKEDALDELVRRSGISAAEVLALGDAEADAGMLRWAGVGVAMGNAMPEARAAAQWVAPTHDEAGFAAAVERFVLRSGGAERV